MADSPADKIETARALLARHDAGLKVGSDPLWASLRTVTDLAETQAQENAKLRAENERLQNMVLLVRFSEVFAGSHRHLKSGNLYDHLGTGRIQSDQPLTDMDDVEVYIGASGDLWARRQVEFHDGRFAEILPALGPAP